MSRWKPVGFLLGGAILVCLALILFFGEFEFMNNANNSNDHIKDYYIPAARQRSTLNDSAFVFLALGAQANQLNCPAAVESLVRFGGWDGDVYMITDRADCFDERTIIKNAGMKPDKFHLTVVDEDFSSGGFDFLRPKVGSRKNRVKSFAMKARLFDVVTDPRIKVLAYVDCDILFAVEGCAAEFIQAGPCWEDRPIKFSKLSHDKKSGRLDDLHAGTMIAHRDASRETLRVWRAEIEKGDTKGDNDAYMQAYHRIQRDVDRWDADNAQSSLSRSSNSASGSGNSNRNSSNGMRGAKGRSANATTTKTAAVQRPANVMLPGEAVRPGGHGQPAKRYEKFLEPHNVSLHCMNHIPKARCLLYGRDSIQTFVDRFALHTYEGKYPYCTHTVLQPLLYGWFPFSYLPFCPKMEQYL